MKMVWVVDWQTSGTIQALLTTQKQKISGITNDKVVEFVYKFNKEAPLWDEFDPTLIKLSFNLKTITGDLLGQLLSTTVNSSNSSLLTALDDNLKFIDIKKTKSKFKICKFKKRKQLQIINLL